MKYWFSAGLVACLTACAPHPPSSAEIESMGVRASKAHQVKALQQLESWSQSGFPVAQREFALALLPNSTRWAEARDWLMSAARKGDAEAAYLLGDAYRIGRYGLQPQPAQAIPWFELAARKHHADAELALARQWRNGDGTARDDAKAFQWLKQASEHGNSQAMFLLSQCYAEGQGTAVSLADARRWLEASADRHYSTAIQAYALALQNGELGLEKNPQEAAELLVEASEERRNRWNAR